MKFPELVQGIPDLSLCLLSSLNSLMFNDRFFTMPWQTFTFFMSVSDVC